MNVEQKRRHEMEIMELMVSIYCRGNHHTKGQLCPECRELLDYAILRTSKCPFMEDKTFCSACKVHCYAPKMREQVRQVMKYAGPRMMFHHPIIACHHCIITLKGLKAAKGKEKKDVS